MMTNIFSSFDPMWFNLCYKNSPIAMFTLIIMFTTYWFGYSPNNLLMFPIINYAILQFMKSKMKLIKSSSLMMSSLFIMVIYMNLTGMLPYLFSTTSQIIFSLSLGMPLWLFCIMSSMNHSMKMTIAHLLPDSAPLWLNPFLILIESVSISVRPITLSFRLAANMTAGHVVLSLISSFSISLSMNTFLMIMILLNLYILFEIMICLIQAYIFCLLISLYTNDHP